MTLNVHSVDVGDNLRDAIHLVKKHNIRHLPVLENGHVVGMISTSDLNRLTFSSLFESQNEADEAVLDMLTIPQVMSGNPTSVNPDASIQKVAEIFAKEHFHSLPVVENGDLLGIVTTTDVIRYLLKQY
jgi:CBS domain-containing protein